ncbi:hypothetical protein IFM89_034963 [Coptis chinensis]|uniref:Uncharacterized protein n=1 Tax=Coptis chinensis TaxID=261450 RepID=A0A835I359_9MAGN|nr:hypothetical protein IFM89_034963 [Coptis chinensis]
MGSLSTRLEVTNLGTGCRGPTYTGNQRKHAVYQAPQESSRKGSTLLQVLFGGSVRFAENQFGRRRSIAVEKWKPQVPDARKLNKKRRRNKDKQNAGTSGTKDSTGDYISTPPIATPTAIDVETVIVNDDNNVGEQVLQEAQATQMMAEATRGTKQNAVEVETGTGMAEQEAQTTHMDGESARGTWTRMRQI